MATDGLSIPSFGVEFNLMMNIHFLIGYSLKVIYKEVSRKMVWGATFAFSESIKGYNLRIHLHFVWDLQRRQFGSYLHLLLVLPDRF